MGVPKIDNKIQNALNAAYRILHIEGYYEEINDVKTIQSGFEKAEYII
ncbi:MAG: DUF5618 family protein [Bacteroidota bacterium]